MKYNGDLKEIAKMCFNRFLCSGYGEYKICKYHTPLKGCFYKRSGLKYDDKIMGYAKSENEDF